jgi:3'-phosphoadenosine 5'-phosphosulfate sulfotransferase (PAPS reductase)/FAD synthetase
MRPPPLELPDEVSDLAVVASVSCGKDSTALMLALREAGIPFKAVFADTGWEAKETYEHLDYLRDRLGPIDVVKADGGMVAKARKRAGFPSRLQRWCTRELKIVPLRAYHDELIESGGVETVSALGIRADESRARASLKLLDDEPPGSRSWGGWVWRPLLRWSVADVLSIHARHGIALNPLYHRGHDRVGCFPCIMSRKEEIRLIAEHAPERISELRELEAELTALRAARNEETPGRYAHEKAAFFLTRTVGGSSDIDEIVRWSTTAHGGRQLHLLQPVPTGGCMRWGLCDVSPDSEDAEE